MINIMYLVLTAILALNVSSEILNAFKTIDDSFVSSNEGLSKRSQDYIKAFDDTSNQQFANKIALWKPRAEKIKELSDQTFDYIEGLKIQLKKESGINAKGEFKEDDLEASTRLFLNGPEGQTKGDELYNYLNKYKSDLSSINDTLAKEVARLPDFVRIPETSNKENEAQFAKMKPAQHWANKYFHMTPTIASIAILSKFQNDIRNSQTQLIEYCYRKINSTVLKPADFEVVASPNSSLLMAGDELVITAGLGAYNMDTKPVVSIDGANVAIGPNGQAVFKTTASSPGEYTKRVNITYNDPDNGEQKTKTAEVKYKVGIPTGLNVSADATRFFYAGAPKGNPISISGAAGGAGSIQVIPVSGIADVKKTGNGTYSVYCNTLGTAVLKVTDGKAETTVSIPVKKLPDPQAAYIFGTFDENTGQGGTVGASEFKLQQGIKAVLPEDFVFNKDKDNKIEYKIKSFIIQCSGKGFNGTESKTVSTFSSASDLTNRCIQGSQVTISDIIFYDAANIEHKLKSKISYLLR
jgi:gliding motility-associated protein GldM